MNQYFQANSVMDHPRPSKSFNLTDICVKSCSALGFFWNHYNLSSTVLRL